MILICQAAWLCNRLKPCVTRMVVYATEVPAGQSRATTTSPPQP
jgi:hypothetical protein